MYDFIKTEEEILAFWEKKKIFDKLREKTSEGPKFNFLDGPITANNPMGVHHAWGRTYKDLFQRFKAMQGYHLRWQMGFDCQGLWVEREEEKALGLRDKKDIEDFGILNFVKACRARVEKYSKIQANQSIRLGMWSDWDIAYYTMSDSNNLHNWMLLKHYFDKGWLYKGKDVVPWCWRCGTASSKHDIITEGYQEVTHDALFMQFPIKGKENEYFVIFTTTPWTLPGDVAIAVNEDVVYAKASKEGKFYWIAEARLHELKGDYIVLEQKIGKELKGWEYEMPYKDFDAQKDAPHKVVLWEMASEAEGTGIVHIAPGSGAEDHQLGKELGLPAIDLLDGSGTYLEGYGDFSGKKYSEVNKMVIKDMTERGFIFKVVPFTHRYPHCWRCSEELVFRLVDEWYIKCDEMRGPLKKSLNKTKWFPEYGKVRQDEWFNNMGAWLISRKRYWGLPLPIWECECGELFVAGSLEALKEVAVDPKKVDELPEVHRPWVDDIKVTCAKCAKEVTRVEDVGDAWLDAGIVPFSAFGTYLDSKKEWQKWYPVDLISENLPGQFRGWFNAILWSSVALTGRAPFKNLLGYETLKDENGDEMHKSKGNAIWFDDAVEKIGADPMRLLYCLQDPVREMRFGFNVLKEPQQNINILYNLRNLVEKVEDVESLTHVADKWIISRLNTVIREVTAELDVYHPHTATRKVQSFWLNDLSRTYIQFVRPRLAEGDKDALFVLKKVYLDLLKLCAPVIPFVSEAIFLDLKEKLGLAEESVHLFDWPKCDESKIDLQLEKDFDVAFGVIQSVLAAREKAKIGVRWPLAKVTIVSPDADVKSGVERLKGLILRQVNIKQVELVDKMKGVKIEASANMNAIGKCFKQSAKIILAQLDDVKLKELVEKKTLKVGEFELDLSHVYIKEEVSEGLFGSDFGRGVVYLDANQSEELLDEGYMREIVRRIQQMRKENDLVKSDSIELSLAGFDKFKEEISKRVGASEIYFEDKSFSIKDDFKVKDKEFKISFNKK